MVKPGEQVPHFDVAALDGRRVPYTGIWQRSNLVLVSLPPEPSSGEARVLDALSEGLGDLDPYAAECVVTRDSIPGVPRPGLVIADRWGEIAFVRDGATTADLPPAPEILEWLSYVQRQCPECQGETR